MDYEALAIVKASRVSVSWLYGESKNSSIAELRMDRVWFLELPSNAIDPTRGRVEKV